jgi:GH25 family lysozyme M1 (1,4-beta-N-acetylmuramidase)
MLFAYNRKIMKKTITVILLLILAISSAGIEVSAAYDDRSDNRVHDKRFRNSLIVDGVDVSSYQDDDIDWEAAKASGIDFAIMRISVTLNRSGNIESDKSFREHYNNARRAGMMCGVYVFSQAVNAEEGAREAEFAISRLQKLGIGPEDLMLPVYMDYERIIGRPPLCRIDLPGSPRIECIAAEPVHRFGRKRH